MERWPSGRRRTTGNRVTLNRVPGFKSLSLRHKKEIPPQPRWYLFFIVEAPPFEPSHERHSVPRLQVCAGLQNALRHPLAQTWVRKSLSPHLIESPPQSRWYLFFIVEAPPFEPSHERHTVPRLQVCAGHPNALCRPLAQTRVRKFLSLRFCAPSPPQIRASC